MKVQKRDGSLEDVKFDKVTARLKKLADGLSVSCELVAQKVLASITDGISTSQIDEISADVAVSMSHKPDYEKLAARILVSNLQKNCPKCQHPERDYLFDYFGIKTLIKSYLGPGETPQHMFMRVARQVAEPDDIIETYNALSTKKYIHATPTLFNSGTLRPQLASCFVEGTPVFTVNRGPVPIENIKIGDNVITHTGSVKAVVQTHKNQLSSRQLFDIKIYKTPGITVTGNHRFWSLTKEQLSWGDKPGWNSIEHLRVGDWIAIPKSNVNYIPRVIDMHLVLKNYSGIDHFEYTFEFNDASMRRNTTFHSEYRPNGVRKNGEWFNRMIHVDVNYAWFLGAWYGDGCVLTRKTSTGDRTHAGISFAQNPNNSGFITDITEIGKNIFGLDTHIRHIKDQNCVQIVFNNSAIGCAFDLMYGKGYDGKHLHPDMFSWDRDMVCAFLGGLVSTDGCCTLNGGIVLQLSNQPLIQSIYHLARSVGLDVSMTIMHKPYKNRMTKIGRMQIPWIPEIIRWVRKVYDDNRLEKVERANSTMEIDGNIFLRINSKERCSDKPEFVYTFGVEDDHSYTVQGVLAENCFLVAMKDDSIEGIYDTKKEMAMISKYAGGIGLHVHNIRAKGSRIVGNNGKSDGLLPMLRTINADARYVNQGGRRKGAVAVYLEPWHADIMDFLELRLNQGDEESRCRDLFSALWIPDLFMKRLETDQEWSLFCPNEAPGLSDVYGDEFDALYQKYESEGKARAKVPIQTIWKAILKSQVETGTPYMLYKDSCNRKSNQKNIGTIKSSNLCTEILEVSSEHETAVCNLASLALPSFVKDTGFDFEDFNRTVRLMVRNLNNVIDRGFYPVKEAETSNRRLRPIGIGVQGLADVFAILRLPFDSEPAAELNRQIFENLYFSALLESCALAKKHCPYDGFWGSPASEGILQFDTWGVKPTVIRSWDWLKYEIKQFGLRNSLLIAPMPTATTSQILGFNECFEPFTSNMYLRRTLAGEFTVVNKYLVEDLRKLDLWGPPLKDRIIRNGGSVQGIPEIPEDIQRIYKTVWEISPKVLINMARDRGAFIDQSQSMNLFVEDPTNAKLSSMHMYAWKQGLKTGMYYLRTRPKAKPIQFSLEPECAMCSA